MAPSDPRLPGGGNYPITVYLANTSAATQNNLKQEKNVSSDGKERDAFYDGVNFNVNARMQNGLFVSVGTQTGRRVDDRCNVVTNFNNGATGPNPRDCREFESVADDDPRSRQLHASEGGCAHQRDGALAAAAGDGATWVVPNTTVRTLLGGTLPASGALLATGNSNIDLTDSEHAIYAKNRRTQVDMRFAKIVRLGRTRADIGVDLWNLFNTNYATAYAGTYTAEGGTWQNPTAIYAPRFVRLNFTVDF